MKSISSVSLNLVRRVVEPQFCTNHLIMRSLHNNIVDIFFVNTCLQSTQCFSKIFPFSREIAFQMRLKTFFEWEIGFGWNVAVKTLSVLSTLKRYWDAKQYHFRSICLNILSIPWTMNVQPVLDVSFFYNSESKIYHGSLRNVFLSMIKEITLTRINR